MGCTTAPISFPDSLNEVSSFPDRVYRIVHQRPERLSLQLLAALCDILGCGVEDLLTVTATDVRRKKAASAGESLPPIHGDVNNSERALRARVLGDDD